VPQPPTLERIVAAAKGALKKHLLEDLLARFLACRTLQCDLIEAVVRQTVRAGQEGRELAFFGEAELIVLCGTTAQRRNIAYEGRLSPDHPPMITAFRPLDEVK
jgi:hypothetical protein